MQYILVMLYGVGQAYQVIQHGSVVRYVDPDGAYLFDSVPTGIASDVVDANPPTPSWHVEPVELVEVVEEPVYVAPPRRVSKLMFVGLLGKDFHTILTVAKSSVDVEMFVRMLDWATPEADGTAIDLDDPRVVYALNSLEAAGLMAPGRAMEILHA
jgi:hypothetical protein